MTTTENPIMEYLHTILERTDQLVEDVTDLRHRMAKLEQAVLKKKLETHVRASSAPHKRLAHQLNAMSENPDRMKRMAKALGLCEQSILLRIGVWAYIPKDGIYPRKRQEGPVMQVAT